MRLNAKPPLFVETTILIRSRVGYDEEKERIDRNLAAQYRLSSTYVKAEYLSTFLRAAVEMYNCVLTAQELGEVPGLWNRWRGGLRSLGMDILWLYARDCHTKNEALSRLQALIEDDIPLWPERIVDEITDATGCEAANYTPPRSGETYSWTLQFPPREAPEGLRRFLSDNKSLLHQLHDSITSRSRHWHHVKMALAHVLAGNYDAVGVRGWQRLSDVIIALEAKAQGALLYTTNLQHFKPICDAIGVRLH